MAEDKKEDPKLAQLRQRGQRQAKAMAAGSPTQFVQETITELKKTTWPSQPVLIKSTYVVLFFILATAIWVGVIDALLTRVGTQLFHVTNT